MSLMLVASMLLSFGAYATEKGSGKPSATLATIQSEPEDTGTDSNPATDSDTITDSEPATDSEPFTDDEPDSDYDPYYGDVCDHYYPHTAEGWREYIKAFCEFILEHYNNDQPTEDICSGFSQLMAIMAQEYLNNKSLLNSMSSAKLSDVYSSLKSDMLTLRLSVCNELVELGLKESNEHGYFDECSWEAFSVTVASVRDGYQKGYVSRKMFEDLCKRYNDLMDFRKDNNHYDVNQDLSLDLLDVVILQRYLVGLEELSSTQKYAVSRNKYDDANMETVVIMQRIVAELYYPWDYMPSEDINLEKDKYMFIKLIFSKYTDDIERQINIFELDHMGIE